MSDELIQRVARKVQKAKISVFSSLDEVISAGYSPCGCGLVLRAADDGSTEVWAIEAAGDGNLTVIRRDDLGYDPELRSVSIEKKVVAVEKGTVRVPGYGVGKRVGTSADGGVIVEFYSGTDDAKRVVFSADVVEEIRPRTKVAIRLAAKNPETTSLKEYAEQYYVQAYGEEYGKKLAETFGDLLP